MNENFRQLLDEATRLTRGGDAAAATRAIQEALGRSPGEGAMPPDAAGAGTASGPWGHRAAPRRDDPTVIDGDWWRGAAPATARDAAARAGERTAADGAGVDVGVADEERRRAADTAGDGGDVVGEGGEVSRGRHAGAAGTLEYRLFVPARASDAPPPALLVMLHGCTQDAEGFATGTRMDALAREHGFLVLYPEQSSRANPQRCWNWFKHTHQRRGRGEPGMIEETVRALVAEHGVDAGKVFVAGLSAGGAMAAILGDLCPELFAAVGVHSGLAAGSASDLPGALAAMQGGAEGGGGMAMPVRRDAPGPATRQPPTIVFHGDADRTVHPSNARRVVARCLDGLPNASEAMGEPERDTGGGGRRWSREVHRAADGRVVVEHWCVHGAGHAWSGGDPRGSYVDAAGPDASAEMVRFFLAGGAR